MVMSPPSGPAFRIGFLLVDGFALMSYSAAVEPLRAANLLADRQYYDIRQIPAAGHRAISSSGAIVEATADMAGPPGFDLVMVVAGGDPAAFRDARLFQWLRRLDRRGVRLGGVSGGPVILASAGLMEGRRMTAHWEHAAALAEISPTLIVQKSLYVFDRDRITCAGGTAPLDMMHALLTEHHGHDFARRVSDWFMHTEVRPSAGPQRAGLAERYGTTNPAILRAIEAMENHVADPLDLKQLAALCGLGRRQLNRLFADGLGRATMAFYRDLRLATARNLVARSPLTITEIALATGFASSAHFAKAFRDRYGVAPSSLRRRTEPRPLPP
jgi:transcriptional regulator GlxA family with amidase domain